MAAMNSAGFGDDVAYPAGCLLEQLFCGGPFTASYPEVQHSSGFGWTVSLGWAFHPRFEARVQASATAEVWVTGRQGGPDPLLGDFLGVRERVQTSAALLAFRQRGFRLSLGPSLNAITMEVPYAPEVNVQATKLGFVAEAALSFPERSRVFMEAAFQYRYAGSVDFGPVAFHDSASRPAPTFPRTSVSMTTTGLSVGVGLRLPW